MKNKNKYQLKHIIQLSVRQKQKLEDITHKGKHGSCEIKRAQVLLKSSKGVKDKDIAKQVGVTVRTIERIRQRFCAKDGGLDRALYDLPRSGQPPRLDDAKEAKLIAIACSNAPEGYDHWTLSLLQKKLIDDQIVSKISLDTIHRQLLTRGIKPWREKNVVRSQPQ